MAWMFLSASPFSPSFIPQVAPKTVYDIADAHVAELKRLEELAPKKKRASDLLRAHGDA